MLNLAQFKNGILIVAIAIGVVIGSYYLGRMSPDDSKYQTQIANWKGTATMALTRNAEIIHTVDSLNAVVFQNKKLAVSQTDTIKQLQARADSIRNARSEVTQVLAQLPDTCAPAKVVIISQGQEIDTLRTALDVAQRRDSIRLLTISSLEVGVKQLQTQNDSLIKVIKLVPVYHEPKFLGFIPEPSRTFSFVGGILVGVGTVLVISHQVR